MTDRGGGVQGLLKLAGSLKGCWSDTGVINNKAQVIAGECTFLNVKKQVKNGTIGQREEVRLIGLDKRKPVLKGAQTEREVVNRNGQSSGSQLQPMTENICQNLLQLG